MASYRVRVEVGRLRPQVPADDVLPAAVTAARTLTTVEAHDVGVLAGRPHVTVRFTATDDAEARAVGRAVHGALRSRAQLGACAVTRRDGARWTAVR